MNTSQFNVFPEQASAQAFQMDLLFLALSGITVFFTVLIVGLLILFGIRYRRKHEDEIPEQIHGSLILEIGWSLIPLVIALGVFAWGAWIYFSAYRMPADAMEIFVTGKQWMWKIQHPSGKREINELHLPINRPVKLTITSEDVIHSVFIPAFRVKKDAVPGRFNSVWFEPTKLGEYHLFCTEYCGTEHSLMIGRVTVMEDDAYSTWADSGPGVMVKAGGSLESQGEALFSQLGCKTCHSGEKGAQGPALDGVFGHQVALQGGGKVLADESYLRESILMPAAKVVDGFTPVMPTYEGQIGEENLQKLVAYIKSLGGSEEQ